MLHHAQCDLGLQKWAFIFLAALCVAPFGNIELRGEGLVLQASVPSDGRLFRSHWNRNPQNVQTNRIRWSDLTDGGVL